MIEQLNIGNFKLYKEDTSLPLSRLNLLTGRNGKGKSTALQIFLLLSQSALGNRATDKIVLNGLNVKLGSFGDVKNKDISSSELITLSFKYISFTICYFLSGGQGDSSDLQIEKIVAVGTGDKSNSKLTLTRNGDLYSVKEVEANADPVILQDSLFDLFINDRKLLSRDGFCSFIKTNLNLTNIHYVSADRIGPKNYYDNISLGNFVSVGALGENTVNVLHHKGSEHVNGILLKGYCRLFSESEENLSKTIYDHTNYWVDKIFQGAKVKVEPIKGEDLLKLTINSDAGGTYFKPTNVGYGFSYSLPIIVAGLIAKPGELFIVENPEAHLHPYAQSILAKFLSLVSETGVQVLIESHSEHILNGLRVAVYDKLIKEEDLNVLYFSKSEAPYFEKIRVDSEGGIDDWPSEFFDQAVKDLNHLFGI